MKFRDVLYGEIELPDWLSPFLRLPELLRLRGVRLSNVDSLQYKDFGSATRYDHALGVVHLAIQASRARRLDQVNTVHLLLAALLHDVGTPPFGHTLELVCDDVDHELEAWNALGLNTRGAGSGFNAANGELPQFLRRCASTALSLGIPLRPEAVGELINGEGDLGFLLKGTIDLDNIDNVLRGAHYMGLPYPRDTPELLACWLASQDSQPSLDGDLPQVAKEWISVRDTYYRLFFDCSDEEQGRQALLQFIIRESIRLGMPKERLLKATDLGLVNAISAFADGGGRRFQVLRDAIRKYLLLEPFPKIAELHLDEKSLLDAFRVKLSISVLESDLRNTSFVPMIFLSRRRFPDWMSPDGSLFGYPLAKMCIFALYEQSASKQGKKRPKEFPSSGELSKKVISYAQQKPWREVTSDARNDLKESLSSWGNWAFTSSRNESMHTYPSSYVHTIPAAFIKSLRLSGGTVLDPFCGSGITGIEGARAGCHTVCGDINEIGLLITKVRTTYLAGDQRAFLREVDKESLQSASPADLPTISNLDKWHHPDTADELARILSFLREDECLPRKQFMELSFSAILTAATARRGKHNSWFADNTPLGEGQEAPEYVDAYELFLAKLRRNLRIYETSISDFERRGEGVAGALSSVSVVRANIDCSNPASYGLREGSVDGIVTSPPYLGMSDYSLGQRLSYAWLYPDHMERDYREEIGARRRRFNKPKAASTYMASMEKFAGLCKLAVRPGGSVALVLGAPDAKRFNNQDMLKLIQEMMLRSGFDLLWESWRPINWHRNHGVESLRSEQLTVYIRHG